LEFMVRLERNQKTCAVRISPNFSHSSPILEAFVSRTRGKRTPCGNRTRHPPRGRYVVESAVFELCPPREPITPTHRYHSPRAFSSLHRSRHATGLFGGERGARNSQSRSNVQESLPLPSLLVGKSLWTEFASLNSRPAWWRPLLAAPRIIPAADLSTQV